MPELVLVGLRLGLDGSTSMTGSGKVIDSRMTGWSGSLRVSPVKDSLSPTAAAMSPGVDVVDLLAMVGVHLEDAADAAPCLPFVALST